MPSPTPAKTSKRDARYLNLYQKPVGEELYKLFGSSKGFSIAQASDKLEAVSFLHYSTRYDVVGAVVRYLRLHGVLVQNGKKFVFAEPKKKKRRVE